MDSIREQYERTGYRNFYHTSGATYRNPHEDQLRRALERVLADWKPDLSHVLDLAAGSGEVTLVLRGAGAGRIDGIDPFTYAAYERRTGSPAGRESFEQIAEGALSGRRYSLIVCSYAMHLVDASRLPQLAYQLACVAGRLLILSPHKRPDLRESWGWTLERETVVERVRARLYRSTLPAIVSEPATSS